MTLPAEILRVARQNHRELARLDAKARAALGRQLSGVLASVLADLNAASSRSLFERGQLQWVVLMLRLVTQRSEVALGRVLTAALSGGIALGDAHAREELGAWLTLRGRASALNIGAAAVLSEQLILERSARSLATWQAQGVARMRPHLVRAVLARESDASAAQAIEQAFGARRFAAERIVRTELSGAYHTAHLDAMRQAQTDGLSVQKTCIAIFDGRTADDSRTVHNQVRALDDEFVDGAGRRYQAPPGRPNDREKMVAWLPPL